MSTIEKMPTPTPRKPWAPTPIDRAKTAGILVAAIAVSLIVLMMTPLSGKLAFVTVFFIAYLTIDFVVSFAKAGRAAAVDSVFRGLATTAIASTCCAVTTDRRS